MTHVLARETKVLKEAVYYLPTYIVDDKGADAPGACSLFVREYRAVETKGGNRRIDIATDVLAFADEDAMAEAIREHNVHELPAAAEGDRLYLPGAFRMEGFNPYLTAGRSVSFQERNHPDGG